MANPMNRNLNVKSMGTKGRSHAGPNQASDGHDRDEHSCNPAGPQEQNVIKVHLSYSSLHTKVILSRRHVNTLNWAGSHI